jgi:hypothetical protein
MADVYGYEPGLEPPSIQALALSPSRFNDRESDLMAAVAKVAACHAVCVALNREMEATGAELTASHTRCRALQIADTERRRALIELSDTPATSAEALSAKLNIIKEMFMTYGREDPEMVERLMEFAHESAALSQRFELEKPLQGSWRKTFSNNRSLRRFMDVAIALSSALFCRLDTGDFS